MDISYKKDGNQNYMIIKELNIDENDYRLQMVINNDIKGIVPMKIKNVNNQIELHYLTSSLISIASAFGKKLMSGRDIYNLVKDVKKISDNMREYLLNINGIIFDPELIYYEKENQKFYFCYCPNNDNDYQVAMRNFFDNLLVNINHDDHQAVLIAYGIQQLTIGDNFTVQDLMDCAERYIQSEKQEKCVCEENIERCRKYENNSEMELDGKKNGKTANKGWLQHIAKIFNGRGKYKNEDELLREDCVYGEQENNYHSILDRDDLSDEMENATMLLTSMGAIENITLRRLDVEGVRITPNKYPCVLGKSKRSSDFYIDSPVVSRVHMRILQEMTGYFIEDLNSTNGTFLNGIQLQPHELKEINVGDQITIANVDFIVE